MTVAGRTEALAKPTDISDIPTDRSGTMNRHPYKINTGRLCGGVALLLAVLLLNVIMFTRGPDEHTPENMLGLLVWSVCCALAGLVLVLKAFPEITQARTSLQRCVQGVQGRLRNISPDVTYVAMGLGTATLGLFLVCIAFVSREDEDFPAGRVPVALVGGGFLLAGLFVLSQWLHRVPGRIRLFFNTMTGLLVLTLLGLAAAWVALFAPGQGFETVVDDIALPGSFGQGVGRIGLGLVAVMMLGLAGTGWVNLLRERRKG
jgi:MFS family permease